MTTDRDLSADQAKVVQQMARRWADEARRRAREKQRAAQDQEGEPMTTNEPKRSMHGRRPPRPKTTRPCVICGKPATGRADVQTCSLACRSKKQRRDAKAAK